MKRAVKRAALAAAAGLLLLTAGCGFKDIDKRFFVVTMGIDKAEDETKKYRITLKLAIPNPQERFGSNQFSLVRYECNSVTECVRIMKSRVDKELDFGHTKAILIGSKLLDETEDIHSLLDWLLRRRDIQRIALLAAAKPDAETVMQLKPNTERLPSNQLFLMFGQTGTVTSYIVSEYLYDFGRRVDERGLDPVLPIVEPRESEQVTINRVMLFNKTRKVMELSSEETRIFGSLYENIGKADFRIGDGDDNVVFSMDSVSSSVSTKREADGSFKLVLKASMSGIVEENADGNVSDLHAFESKIAQTAEGRLKKLIAKFQKAKIDPLGFGLDYRAKHYVAGPQWEEWEEGYPKAAVEVKVKVKLNGTGVIR